MSYCTKKILIIDDSKVMRRIIVGYLAKMSLTSRSVFEASCGRKALEILASEDIALILSDWSMQGQNGLDLLKVVRENHATQHLPFIMITAEGQLYHILQAFRTHVSDYIVKPFTFSQFEYVMGKFLSDRGVN